MAKPDELLPVLIFLNGELTDVPTPLERETITLGRALEVDVRLNDPHVSRRHAQILTAHDLESGETVYRLIDLNSKNGTLVNDRPVTKVVLKPGDKIGIGSHLLKFELIDQVDFDFQKQFYRLLAHDELTGLLSSRSFFFELRREVARATSENRAFCVLMLDLDCFKAVNDRFGHVTGSKTLAEVSNKIARILRAGDAAARLGSEEFAIFLLDAELRQGLVAAERIRQTVEKAEFAVLKQFGKDQSGGDLPETNRVTISIGVAAFPRDSSDPVELVEMANTALNRAKQTGRNRVCPYREINDDDKIVSPRAPRR